MSDDDIFEQVKSVPLAPGVALLACGYARPPKAGEKRDRNAPVYVRPPVQAIGVRK